MTSVGEELAQWAHDLSPEPADLALADRSLVDTLATTFAGRTHRVARVAADLPEGARWATVGHVLDFDDLHMPSTTHISVVCVPAALAAGGDARAYLAAAGVMARIGSALGWAHFSAGWHSTCTAGAPAAAVAGAVALGLDPAGIATALALAVPGAGGVQRSFGSDGKSLQVGFAVEAGLRAARLAAAGARADPAALDAWMRTVHGRPEAVDLGGPAVPDGLAIKMYPACYAVQRPISALSTLGGGSLSRAGISPADVTAIRLRTPAATVVPLIHHRPTTGLQARFSLEYAAATAVLDDRQGLDSFTDEAVCRPEAQRLMAAVGTDLLPGGAGLLDGRLEVEVSTRSGATFRADLRDPPGSPRRPPSEAELGAKVQDCLKAAELSGLDPDGWTWADAAALLRAYLPV